MAKPKTIEDLTFFRDLLWSASALSPSPVFLRPFFVERYSGPRAAATVSLHAFWEFTIVLNGSGRLHLHDRVLPMHGGMLILIPPGVGHREESNGIDTIWIGYEGRLMGKAATGAPISLTDPALTKAAEKLWLFSQRRFGSIGFEIDGMLLTLIGGFFRALDEGGSRPARDPVEKAIVWMHEHFAENIGFADVGAMAGVSEGYFYRLFKKRTGKSPAHYLTSIRIERAARALRMSSVAIAEVAADCGYPDPFYFSRVFKRHTGQSPAAFRGNTLRQNCRIHSILQKSQL